jgi:aryl-alcohol dehydrogenase-like predicted oxidoreductase
MNYRRIGDSGLVVSEIGLGSWITHDDGDIEKAAAIHRAAYDNGINFFDTANVYGHGLTETVVGHAIRGFRREAIVLATKAFWPYESEWPFPGANDRGLSRKHLFQELDKSLGRLGVEYVDLYQCHRFDENTVLSETCKAMHDLVESGKTLYWGTSEWTGVQIAEAVAICDEHNWTRPISNQPLYNMLERHWELDTFPETKRLGLGNVCFSPLAEGLLTGKYADGVPDGSRAASEQHGKFLRNRFNDANHAKTKRLADVADDLGVPLATLALAWCLRRTEISSCIIGASRPEQVLENAKAPACVWDEAIEARIAAILGG